MSAGGGTSKQFAPIFEKLEQLLLIIQVNGV